MPRLLEQTFVGLSREAIYREIMRLGEQLPPFDSTWKTESNRVLGCQSLMYLHVAWRGEGLFFAATSDALISKGLAAVLILAYQGMHPTDLLKTEPTFLCEYGIIESLSPTRANGVANLWLKMKQEAVQLMLK